MELSQNRALAFHRAVYQLVRCGNNEMHSGSKWAHGDSALGAVSPNALLSWIVFVLPDHGTVNL